jgi:type I restriction enzyme M protein
MGWQNVRASRISGVTMSPQNGQSTNPNRVPQDIIAKLWHLCNILRDAGITYPEYVTELTYLLFLRMAEETKSETALPPGYRWRDLASKGEPDRFPFYKELLRELGCSTRGRIAEIFKDAQTWLTNPKDLNLLVKEFSRIDWYPAREESALADLYEGLLEKNSTESKAGAGQYFTPRPVVECMVQLIKPQPGEIIQDPACGTAGFLIAADRYIKHRTKNFATLSKPAAAFQRKKAFIGVELVPTTHRLALMNTMLHGIFGPLHLGDTLGDTGLNLPAADVILTNPPFGTKKGGGLPSRVDFEWRVSNKQLCFLQHVYKNLRAGGRAAVVMPDLQGRAASEICRDLMERCRVHTVLRLPSGIFYAPGIKTTVLFFTRGKTNRANTKKVWVYDLRSNMPAFGKRLPFGTAELADFVKSYGRDPHGNAVRKSTDRFRLVTRDEIKRRGDVLDFGGGNDEVVSVAQPTADPRRLIEGVRAKLRAALSEIESLGENLAR